MTLQGAWPENATRIEPGERYGLPDGLFGLFRGTNV
jgi:hypothetical protein